MEQFISSKDNSGAQIRSLDLGDCDLTDTKFLSKMIANMMGKIKVLHELNLSGNNLDKNSALDIANMLVENHNKGYKIEKLDISNNKLGTEGLQAFCSILVGHETGLIELNIEDNNIPDSSLKALLALVFENDQIETLKYTLSMPHNQASREKFFSEQNVMR